MTEKKDELQEVGTLLKFVKYEGLEPGSEPILVEGDIVIINDVNPSDNSYLVTNDQGMADTVFVEEVAVLTDEEQEEYGPSFAADEQSEKDPDPVQEEAGEIVDQEKADHSSDKEESKEAQDKKKPAAKKKASSKKKAVSKKKVASKKNTAENKPDTSKGKEVKVTDSKSVTEMLASTDAIEAVRAVENMIGENYFTLGGLLHHVYTEESYKALGYAGEKGFQTYCEKETTAKYRKAMYLIRLYECFTALNVDETRLAEIGWSKASDMVNVVNEENFDDLVEYAKNHTREELADYIKTTYVKSGDGSGSKEETAKKVAFKFSLFDDQAKIVHDCLDEARRQNDTDDYSVALYSIIVEWASLSNGVDIPLADAIDALKAKYKVDIEVKE